MTYLQLLQRLQTMPTERLDDTVAVYDPYEDEYVFVIETDTHEEDNPNHVMQKDQLYLILKA
jgi:hypothetical protein